MTKDVMRAMWAVLGTVLLTWVCTWNTPFVEDDWLYLEAVRAARPPASFLIGEGVMDHHYRPLSDALVFFLFDHPMTYHLLLAFALCVAAGAVWMIARAVGLTPTAATLAAALFAGRDLFFPSMVWASGFSDVGSAAFGLAALAAASRWFGAGGIGSLTASIGCTVLAVLTKEIAIVVVPLMAVLAWVQRAPRGRAGPLVGVVAVIAGAVAVQQWRFASFEEGYGAGLYELAVGSHSILRLPVYALWSLVGVREIEHPALGLAGVAVLGGVFIFFLRDGSRPWRGRVGLAGIAWFIVAVGPALLAPNRFHTNYLGIAAAAPCMIAGMALATGLVSRRRLAMVVIAVLWLSGPIVVGLKRAGRLDSGGWVALPRAERLATAVAAAAPLVATAPPRARVLLIGGLNVDMRVLGDPRGRGFGAQQVLASALRVEAERYDLDVLSLPGRADLDGRALAAARHLVAEAPRNTLVIDLGPPARAVTDEFRVP